MSRRIEITVTNEWAAFVRDCLERDTIEKDIEVGTYEVPSKKYPGKMLKKKKMQKKKIYGCNLSESSGKPSMVVEVVGVKNTIFFVTVPSPAVSGILDALRRNAIGEAVGRVILSPLELLKPALSEPIVSISLLDDGDQQSAVDQNKQKPKPKALAGYDHFKLARKTTEELKADITNGATMTINTWLSLIGASIMAAGGLATNVNVFIVAAMLVSPIMGPILGMTFGYRIADYQLFKLGFINELKMAACAWSCGALFGLLMGHVGNTYQWPNDSMMPEKTQGFNLIFSILVSAAAGLVLGVALTGPFSNGLVGTAISAGLLPPIVNAGMLCMYSWVYAPASSKGIFYEMGNYALLFYFTHVITIIFVANFVFWLKDVNPRFRDMEDSKFEDLPSIADHKERIRQQLSGKDTSGFLGSLEEERLKANYFLQEGMADLKNDLTKLKDQGLDLVSTFTGGLINVNGGDRQRRGSVSSNDPGDVEMGNTTYSPLNSYNEKMKSSGESSGNNKNNSGNSNNSSNSGNNSNNSSGNNKQKSSVINPLQRGNLEESKEGHHSSHASSSISVSVSNDGGDDDDAATPSSSSSSLATGKAKKISSGYSTVSHHDLDPVDDDDYSL